MALFGRGVLAIWNGIDPESEADFVAWHVAEHIPERVGLPGFLRGRRYVAVDGQPKYFNFYETERPETLGSEAYVARLNDPTPWTRRIMAHFHDTSRTICDVVVSLGRGEGAWMEAIQIRAMDSPALQSACTAQIMPALIAVPGVCGAHLLHGRLPAGAINTTETELRGGPDASADWIVMIEAAEESLIRDQRAGILRQANLIASGARPEMVRGIYRLQFSLSCAELEPCNPRASS